MSSKKRERKSTAAPSTTVSAAESSAEPKLTKSQQRKADQVQARADRKEEGD